MGVENDSEMVRERHLPTTYSARHIPTYSVELSHAGLNKHRLLRANDENVLRHKTFLLLQEWTSAWEKECAKAIAAKNLVDLKKRADELTRQAQADLAALESILTSSTILDERNVWVSLLGETKFRERAPKPEAPPEKTSPPKMPAPPNPEFVPYKATVRFVDYFIPGRAGKLRAYAAQQLGAAQEQWKVDHEAWKQGLSEHEQRAQAALVEHQAKEAKAIADWEARRDAFAQEVAKRKEDLTVLARHYHEHEREAVIAYVDAVLSASTYPNNFPQDWVLGYDCETKSLVVDYAMPAPGAIPKLKEVRFIASKRALSESLLTDSQTDKLYDSTLYQLALRVLHEIFGADSVRAVESICLNGFVTAINPGTGIETTACVLSLQVKRDDFMQVNIKQVEPKACFKRFRGVASSKLIGLASVPPIQQINREDSRFVDSHAVLQGVDEGVNLAAMDWQDFEHLIRELFSQEFSADGSEVRVTQASRDGGVDAVVFDADPIRGGKIVIQAKRYTGTVDVSAVRDLYGTVLNEGATKGILVTTSTFGPDSYEFAKGKPITLLNGGNLLHLLTKHGHAAHIDLRAAKLQLQG